jgi:hypothetical protein
MSDLVAFLQSNITADATDPTRFFQDDNDPSKVRPTCSRPPPPNTSWHILHFLCPAGWLDTGQLGLRDVDKILLAKFRNQIEGLESFWSIGSFVAIG